MLRTLTNFLGNFNLLLEVKSYTNRLNQKNMNLNRSYPLLIPLLLTTTSAQINIPGGDFETWYTKDTITASIAGWYGLGDTMLLAHLFARDISTDAFHGSISVMVWGSKNVLLSYTDMQISALSQIVLTYRVKYIDQDGNNAQDSVFILAIDTNTSNITGFSACPIPYNTASFALGTCTLTTMSSANRLTVVFQQAEATVTDTFLLDSLNLLTGGGTPLPQQLPNSSFEQIAIYANILPEMWDGFSIGLKVDTLQTNFFAIPLIYWDTLIMPSTNAYSGNLSAKLVASIGSYFFIPTHLVWGNTIPSTPPTFLGHPLTLKAKDTIKFAYSYRGSIPATIRLLFSPSNKDTYLLDTLLYLTSTSGNWNIFSFVFPADTPWTTDTVAILVFPFKFMRDSLNIQDEAVLLIDNFKVDTFKLISAVPQNPATQTLQTEVFTSKHGITIYLKVPYPQTTLLSLHSIDGKLMYQQVLNLTPGKWTRVFIPAKNGTYILSARNILDGSTITQRLISIQ